MNARAYFTILRPVRTLLLAAFYAWALGLNVLKIIGGASTKEANFLTLVTIAPIFLGSFLLGPLHEVMHRSFSALLPGAREAFLRWHLRAVTVAALLLLGAAEFCRFEFPRAASLGFILAGLSLPLLNTRTAPPYSSWYKAIFALTACAFAASPARVHLIEAGRVLPWLIFTGGAACALFCFRHSFAADRVRERSRNPLLVFCFQSLAPIPGSSFSEMQRHGCPVNG